SYAADQGYFDDMVMTLVSASWLFSQSYFVQLLDIDVRAEISKEYSESLENDIVPVGAILDGINDRGVKDDEPEFRKGGFVFERIL
ncbi:MAG: terminase, partial [bacterium]